MVLWIRTQSKEDLLKVDYITIRDDYEPEKGYTLTAIINKENFMYNITKLGTYKTKERALEVLDEI